MLINYHFSLCGKAHQKSGKPCQDASTVVEITPAWKAILVADGVGSCKHAERASELAVKSASEILKAAFPSEQGTDRDFQSLLLTAAHAAANAIEDYVLKNDPDHEKEYHTTLAMAICSKKTAYYFSVGDSGIIGLDENGIWHSVTHQDNSEDGGVFTLAYRDHYHVGKVKFKPVAMLAVTDGIYLGCFPPALSDEKFSMNVPLLNFFVTYALGISEKEEKEATEKQCENIKKYLDSEECTHMTDDLSVSAVICSDTYLQESDIPYETPDLFAVYWKMLQYRPYSEEDKQKQFENFIQDKNPEFSPEEVSSMAENYMQKTQKKAVS